MQLPNSIIYILLWVVLSVTSCNGQPMPKFNLGFEDSQPKTAFPKGWINWSSADYEATIDSNVKYSGRFSLRIGSKKHRKNGSFGGVGYAIPARYKGSVIELKGMMRFDSISNGNVGLLLRIDGELGILQFDNMNKRNIHGSSDWKAFSVKLNYPKNAKTIYVGAVISGNGKLWVDDLKVYIDGKNIQSIQELPESSFKADRDTAFSSGSKISSIKLDPYTVNNLATLGKVWGFLKYYHPNIVKGDYNWDNELFRVLPKILKTTDFESRNKILLDWVLSLGNVRATTTKENAVRTEKVKMEPDLGWIESKALGGELAKKLNDIKNSHREPDSYYVGLTAVGNPEFKNERAYKKISYPDAGMQLLSLYRYWNIINYYFPYKYLISENWEEILGSSISPFVSAKNETEYKLAVLSLIAKVHDTHANIWSYDDALNGYWGTNKSVIDIKFIEGKAVVTDAYDEISGKETRLKNGDIITSVDKKSIAKIIKEQLKYRPASNYPTQLRDIANNLLRTNAPTIKVGYKRDNINRQTELKAYTSQEVYLSIKNKKRDTCFKMINDSTSYIYAGTIKNKYIRSLIPQILKSKRLVIDLRSYPNEFFIMELGKYLYKKPTPFAKFSNGSITDPGLFTLKYESKIGDFNYSHGYNGKVVLLVDEGTQSQGEYTAMAFRQLPNSVVIGSTTAGADGNLSRFTLPGAISTAISGVGVYYPDGRETQRVGIVPDIFVTLSINDIKNGKDRLLEVALKQ